MMVVQAEALFLPDTLTQKSPINEASSGYASKPESIIA